MLLNATFKNIYYIYNTRFFINIFLVKEKIRVTLILHNQ